MGPGSTGRHIAWTITCSALLLLFAPSASAQTVNISGLSDVTLPALRPSLEVRNAQSICAYSDALGNGYMISAQGSGSGGAFVLTATGGADLPFGVEWSDQPGDSTGTALSPGLALSFQSSGATDQTCSSGPAETASLIVTIASQDLYAASAGVSYSGTLSLTIAPQ